MKESSYYKKIRKIILVSMILVPFIPFILVIGINYSYFKTSINNRTIASINRIVSDHQQMIESFLKEREADLKFIVDSYTFQEIKQTEELHGIFERLQDKSNAFADLGVFNEAGVHVMYHGPFKLTGKIYKDADWFKEVMKQGYYISDIFLGYRQIPHFIIAIAREEAGQKWVLRATIDTVMFNNLVKMVRIGKTGEAYILDAKGVLQTDRRSGGNLMDTPADKLRQPDSDAGIKTFIEKDVKGEKYLYATTWLKDKSWLLVVRQEKADAFWPLTSATYLIILVSVIGGATIIIVAFYMTNRLVGRMEQMDTEKTQLGQQLIRATGLAEIGAMATGVAHEINNPLQVMKSEHAMIEMILADLKESGELKPSESLTELEDSVNQIVLQINRCAKITQSVLKFGRQTEPHMQDIDLQSYIPEVTDMIAEKASVQGITIKQEVSADTPPVHGDPGQLQQVLLNLFNNAIAAIEERHGFSGGELVIDAGSKDDKKVEIKVTDNGSGISQDNLEKIFSPFFTTKPVGKGTGLGLSVCFGIIESMGGTIDVSSEQGVGTTFIVTLPAVIKG